MVRTPPHISAAWGGTPGGKNYHVTSGQNATFYVDELETGHVRKRVIDAGDDLERGVRIMYFLDEAAVGEASLTISDGDGNEIETFSSIIPEEKKDRERFVVHHGRRRHEQLPVADDLPQRREDGRHRVPQAAGRTAGQARAPTRRR